MSILCWVSEYEWVLFITESWMWLLLCLPCQWVYLTEPSTDARKWILAVAYAWADCPGYPRFCLDGTKNALLPVPLETSGYDIFAQLNTVLAIRICIMRHKTRRGAGVARHYWFTGLGRNTKRGWCNPSQNVCWMTQPLTPTLLQVWWRINSLVSMPGMLALSLSVSVSPSLPPLSVYTHTHTHRVSEQWMVHAQRHQNELGCSHIKCVGPLRCNQGQQQQIPEGADEEKSWSSNWYGTLWVGMYSLGKPPRWFYFLLKFKDFWPGRASGH